MLPRESRPEATAPGTSPALAHPPTLTNGVVRRVVEMVRAGELVPGRLYSVYQLADLLQVSRSPVREGLLRLEAAGTIRFERNRGFRVVVPDPREIAEIFAVRILLEPAGLRVLATRAGGDDQAAIDEAWSDLREAAAAGEPESFWNADLALHDVLLRRAGNRRSAGVVRQLRDQTDLIGAGTTTRSRSLVDIADEHAPIVEAVMAGDGDAAADAMVVHLRSTALTLVAQSMGVPVESEQVRALWQDVMPGRA